MEPVSNSSWSLARCRRPRRPDARRPASIPVVVEIEDLYEPEWVDWYRMTPEERWNESARLFAHYLALGGSLDPEPDPQSPFLRCGLIASATC